MLLLLFFFTACSVGARRDSGEIRREVIMFMGMVIDLSFCCDLLHMIHMLLRDDRAHFYLFTTQQYSVG